MSGRLKSVAPCRPTEPAASGAHLAHGTGQRSPSGGLERRTDPTVETSVRLVAGPLSAPSCACLEKQAGGGGPAWHWLAARRRPSPHGGSHWLAAAAVIGSPRGDRRSSARRAETDIGSQRGGGHRLAARRLRSSGSAAAPAPAASRQPGNGFGCPACRLFGAGGGLWVLRDDRNGRSRPSGPGAAVTRTELTVTCSTEV